MDKKIYLDLGESKKKVVFCNRYKIGDVFIAFERITKDGRKQETHIAVSDVREMGVIDVPSLEEEEQKENNE
jgi:hypothetical protein